MRLVYSAKQSVMGVRLPGLEKQPVLLRADLAERIVHVIFPSYPVKQTGTAVKGNPACIYAVVHQLFHRLTALWRQGRSPLLPDLPQRRRQSSGKRPGRELSGSQGYGNRPALNFLLRGLTSFPDTSGLAVANCAGRLRANLARSALVFHMRAGPHLDRNGPRLFRFPVVLPYGFLDRRLLLLRRLFQPSKPVCSRSRALCHRAKTSAGSTERGGNCLCRLSRWFGLLNGILAGQSPPRIFQMPSRLVVFLAGRFNPSYGPIRSLGGVGCLRLDSFQHGTHPEKAGDVVQRQRSPFSERPSRRFYSRPQRPVSERTAFPAVPSLVSVWLSPLAAWRWRRDDGGAPFPLHRAA